MGRTVNGKRAGRPRDIRFGGDAVHFLPVRRRLLGWVRLGRRVVLDLGQRGLAPVALPGAGGGGGGRGLPRGGCSVGTTGAVGGGGGPGGGGWALGGRCSRGCGG